MTSSRWTAALALAAATGCGAAHTPPVTAPTAATRPAKASKAVAELRHDLDLVFNAPLASRGVWGIDVRSLDTGESLYRMNAGKLMMPASNMKIVTLAATANTLGWDYRFTTTLETSAPIANGALQGDLVVRSNGDPSINTRGNRSTTVLDEWAAALHAAGISSIDGRIVGDDQAFDDEGIGAGWAWDYLQYGYAAPVGALEFNEDTATLTVAPGPAAGSQAVVSLSAGAGFEVLNRAVTGDAGSRSTVDYRRHMDRAVLEIFGSIPAGATADVSSVAVVNPTVFFAQSLKDGLSARGIAVAGDAVDFDDVAATTATAERRVLVTTQSPPLTEIATVLMKVSQNLYAETLSKALGASRGGLGTWAGGLAASREALKSWGVPDDAYVLYDGSGLSRYNYITPEALTTILARMHNDARHRDAFAATLPIAGKDGTISSRLKKTRAEGNAIAKTGSIANVRALSGYVKTRDGETLAFSILANDFVIPVSSINYIADLGVEILSNFTRKP
jgi:D-alanyl-D-alanine carboxypeptidase/D-alanyl-D-alanine-endopeptidase (penicillin-binding protein 4)